ncbi:MULTISPECIES: hypothetical protein [Chitinophagaceae]
MNLLKSMSIAALPNSTVRAQECNNPSCTEYKGGTWLIGIKSAQPWRKVVVLNVMNIPVGIYIARLAVHTNVQSDRINAPAWYEVQFKNCQWKPDITSPEVDQFGAYFGMNIQTIKSLTIGRKNGNVGLAPPIP